MSSAAPLTVRPFDQSPVPSVLIVDDHRENLLAMEATLETLGVRIVRAASAEEALHYVRIEEFAVVVLDVQMPGMDGYEVARRIKAMRPLRLVPVIFVTALDRDRRHVHDGYESGAVDYLFKPLDPDVLRQKVAAFVRLYEEREIEERRQRQRYADLSEEARQSETRYRMLFDSIDVGFCITEMLFDERGAAMDYRFVEVNPAFERQTGLTGATGRTARELVPGLEPVWFQRYGRVALTGEPVRFESEAPSMGRCFDVFAFRVGRAEDRQVAMLFTDVTEARAAEREREQQRRLIEQARDDAERAHRRTARLQSLTAALVGTRTVDDVAAVVVAQAVDTTGAHTGMLALLDDDGEHATIVRQTGLDPVVPEARQRFPLTVPGATAECLRTGEAQWIESREALLAAHPEVARHVRGAVPLGAVATVPLLVGDAVVGALSFTYPEQHEFPMTERELFLAIARQTSQAIDRARLIESERAARAQAEAAERRLSFLAEASARLAGSLDVEATLATIAELAVPALADWCFVEVLEHGRVRPAAIAHVRPEMVQLVRESLARNPIDLEADFGTGKVLRTGEPELAADIPDEVLVAVAQDAEHLRMLRSVGMRSSISVPLKDARGRAVAVLSLVSSDSGRRFGESDLSMAMELARRAGAALANAQLVESERVARAEAETASRAKSQFLANMSHELRTPLNAIGGHVQLIEMGIHGPVSDAQLDALARVDRAQRHLLGLINDVLNYARLEAGRVEYEITPVSVRDVLIDVLPMVESQVGAKAQTLVHQLPEDRGAPRIYVWADRDKLAQIVLNLLSNGVKFTPTGGTIAVTLAECEDDSDRVSLRVADTGVGIPADRLEAVFEPFVQVRSDLTRTTEGTGLGLAISRDLARGMGGDLRATSELGKGSTFELVLRRVTSVGGEPVERRSRAERRKDAERRSGVDRRG